MSTKHTHPVLFRKPFQNSKIKESNSTPHPPIDLEIERYQRSLSKQKEEILQEIVLNSLWGLKIKQPIPNCTKIIKLDNFKGYDDKTVGKLLGKQGRNQQYFSEITKVEFKFDDENPGQIILTKYNPIEIAKTALFIEALLKNKSWDFQKMKKTYDRIEVEFEKSCSEVGEKILREELRYENTSNLSKIATSIGLLGYCKSFSQNALEHCLEVGNICANMAHQLDMDVLTAKRCGFFHDIGKALVNYSDHVTAGVEIAKECGLDKNIITCIEKHHNKKKEYHPFLLLVQAADKLSAGRYMARPNQMMIIDQRKTLINDAICQLPWVQKLVIKNAGNLLQIYIKLTGFNADNIQKMKDDVQTCLSGVREKYIHDFDVEFILIYRESMKISNK